MRRLAERFPDVHVVSLSDNVDANDRLSWQHFLATQADKVIDKTSCPGSRGKIVFVTWTDNHVQGCVFQDSSSLWQTKAVSTFWNITNRSRLVSFHPVYATAEQVLAINLPVVTGCSVAFVRWSRLFTSAKSDEGSTLFDLFMSGLRYVKPNILVATPLIWTKLITVAQYRLVKRSGALTKMVTEDVLEKGPGQTTLSKPFAYSIRTKVLKMLGLKRDSVMVCYGQLPDSVRHFLQEIGLDMFAELVGFPECGGVYGRVLRDADGNPRVEPLNDEIKITPCRREKLSWISSPGNFSGYFANKELSAAVIHPKTHAVRDWRRLVMSITKMGLYVSSNVIQKQLQKSSAVINSAVVFAEGMKYVGVLLLINADAAEKLLGLPVSTMARSTELSEYLRSVVQKVNQQLPEDHRIVRFCHHVLTDNETKGNLHLSESDLQDAVTKLYGAEVKDEVQLSFKPIDFNIWEPAGGLTCESVSLLKSLETDSSSTDDGCGSGGPAVTTTTTTTTTTRNRAAAFGVTNPDS